MKRIFSLILTVCVLLGIVGAVSVSAETGTNDVFAHLVNAEAPEIAETISTTDMGDYVVVKLRFSSSIVREDVRNEVYTIAAYPKAAGNYPAVLVLHGGTQCANSMENRVKTFAQKGYIALTVDLPGIANPDYAASSVGAWLKYPYGTDVMVDSANPEDSVIFQGVTTAVEGFHLLQSGSFVTAENVTVDTENMGVCGVSWGGYSTTMVAGILGDQVKAAFSEYGSGFYEKGSWWTETLAGMSETGRTMWNENLDAGVRANNIKADYFAAAAANDDYFYPPAVMATLAEIPGHKNQLFAPNVSHNINLPGGTAEGSVGSPNGCSMQYDYFGYYLKGEGTPLPEVSFINGEFLENGDFRAAFDVKRNTEEPLAATLYYSKQNAGWTKRVWEPVALDAVTADGTVTATFPVSNDVEGYDYYLAVSEVSETREVSATSLVKSTPKPPAKGTVLAGDCFTSFLNNAGQHDDSLNHGSYVQWWNTNKTGYRIRVPESGTYTFTMYGESVSDKNKTTLKVDDVVVAESVPFPSCGTSWSDLTPTEIVMSDTVQLEKGTHYIEYVCVAGSGMNFRSFSYEKTGEIPARNMIVIPTVNCDILAGEGLGFHDGSPDGLDGTQYNAIYSPIEAQGEIVSFGVNEWMRYYVYAPKAGWYDLSANYSSGSKAVRFAVTVNGDQIVTKDSATTGDWNIYNDLDIGKVYLKAGDNDIQILNGGKADTAVYGAFQFKSFTLAKLPLVSLFDGETEKNQLITGEMTVKANEEISGVMLVAVYDGNQLMSVTRGTGKLPEATVKTEEGQTLKVLFLEDLLDLKPLYDVVLFQ